MAKSKLIIGMISTIVIILITMLLLKVFRLPISIATDNMEPKIEVSLDKYVNYLVSEQDNGTLVQYSVRTGVEYKQDQSYMPIQQNEINIDLNQIDGQYPFKVKVITKSTQATNGNKELNDVQFVYDNSTGKLKIIASNQNENNEAIYTEGNKDEKDEYLILCYYSTYTNSQPERKIQFNINTKYKLFAESNVEISKNGTFMQIVKEDKGTLSSIDYETDEIYNGYIKSNIINGTEYNTEYKETSQLTVTKKEIQEKVMFTENNTFAQIRKNEQDEEITQDLGNNGNLVYKTTKISKNNVKNLLGDDGVLQVFDISGNILAEINKNTQYAEDGTFTITYENQPEAIIVKTSSIVNEGILELDHVKEIKFTMKDINNIGVKTTNQISGIKEEKIIENEQEKTVTKTTYLLNNEKIEKINDAQTKVDISINTEELTNEKQNEVVFDIKLNSNSMQYNLYKNPTIKIELPEEVEKVLLGESSLLYGNGLQLQEVNIYEEDNGKTYIIASITGEQTQYDINELGLTSNLRIPATIILKKDIESKNENINIYYTNKYNLYNIEERGIFSKEIYINNFEEKKQEESDNLFTNLLQANVLSEPENNDQISQDTIEGLKLELTPTKGTNTLHNGDVIYEGEFIKYNIKVTNETDSDMENVKLVATIPEGVTYGELHTEEYANLSEYKYEFEDTTREKILEIGTLKAGQSVTGFYEVKVNNIQEAEKTVISKIQSYSGNAKGEEFEFTSKIQQAETQASMGTFYYAGQAIYYLNLYSDIDKEVTVNMKVPKGLNLEIISCFDQPNEEPWGVNPSLTPPNVSYLFRKANEDNTQVNIYEDNIVFNATTNRYYEFNFTIDQSKMEKEDNKTETYMISSSEITDNNKVYTSNEARLKMSYNNIKVMMTSEKEGEELKYEDELEYEIKIQNIGGTKTGAESDIDNFIIVNLIDYLPEELDAQTITYNNWELDTEELNGETTIKGFIKKDQIVEDISSTSYDENGDKIANTGINLIIPEGETITAKIKTTVGIVEEKKEIENKAIISGENVLTKTTNTITNTILPIEVEDGSDDPDNIEDYGEEQEAIDIGNEDYTIDVNNSDIDEDEEYAIYENDSDDNNGSNSGNSTNGGNSSGNSNNGNESTDSIRGNNISGIVWLDKNKDGKRQESEKLLSGIAVSLVDLKNTSAIVNTVNTSNYGSYTFSNLNEGNYLVVFRYDSNKYKLTEYQKSNVHSSLNSDAIEQKITLNGNSTLVGVTDTLNLKSSLENIDLGLIEKNTSDFKVEKYISKIQIKTTKGVKEYSYNNASMAKAEIKAKEIDGAIVKIQYKILVTNIGETSGKVGTVVDTLPEGLEVSDSLNNNWIKKSDSKIINTSLSNTNLEPGKTISLTLNATKKMNANSTGIYTNKVEITDIKNSDGIDDGDLSNNNSKADVIISVSTGAIVYVLFAIFILIILVSALIILSKNGKINLKKLRIHSKITGLFIFAFTTMMIFESISNAVNETASFRYMGRDYYNNGFFEGGPNNVGGFCVEHGMPAAGQTKLWAWPYIPPFGEWRNYTRISVQNITTNTYTTSDKGMSLQKKSSDLEYKVESNHCIIGPFEFSCNKNATYSLLVNGKKNGTICNKNGDAMSLTGSGNKSFYVKIPKIYCQNGISSVVLKANAPYTKTVTVTKYGIAFYYYGYGYQTVRTKNQVIIDSTPTKTTETEEKEIRWTDMPVGLEINKVDSDTNSKLAGVKIRVQCSALNYNQIFTTDENGKVVISNLKPGKYTLTEISNPGYGYTAKASGNITITSGKCANATLKNTKQTGNLKIIKKETDTGALMKSIEFKIKNATGKYIVVNNSNGEKITTMSNGRIFGVSATTEANATIFKTDSNGEIMIYNLPVGKYTVVETTNSYGFKPINKNVEVKRQKAYATVKYGSSIPSGGQISNGIYEIETGNNVNNAVSLPMSDNKYITANNTNLTASAKADNTAQKFYFAYSSGKKAYKIRNLSSNRNVTYIGEDLKAKIVDNSSDNSQYWQLVKSGDYYLFKSLANPNAYLTTGLKTIKQSKTPTSDTYKFKLNKTISASIYTLSNTKYTGNLKIIKIDEQGNHLKNVEFKIKNSSGKYIIVNGKKGEDAKVSAIKATKIEETTNAKSATIFKTNASGEIILYNILAGDYTIVETYSPYNSSLVTKEVTVARQRSYASTNFGTITPTTDRPLANGIYQIETGSNANNAIALPENSDGKYIKDNNTNLVSAKKANKTGQKFYIQYNSSKKAYKLINLSSNRNLTYVAKGKVVKIANNADTNSQYWKLIKNGDYYVFESLANATHYLRSSDLKTMEQSKQPTGKSYGFKMNPTISATTVTIKNKGEDSRNIRIIKVDKDTNKVLSGVQFIMKNDKNQYIRLNKLNKITGEVDITKLEYVDENNATILETDSKGEIRLMGLLKSEKYQIKEIKTSSKYGYELDGDLMWVWKNTNKWSGAIHNDEDGKPKFVSLYGDNIVTDSVYENIKLANARKFIKISGNVWEDVVQKAKHSQRNNVFGNEDIYLEGIRVILKENVQSGDDQIVSETFTNSNGYYQFEDVLISKLDNYYIQFEYDGEIYTTVENMYDLEEIESQGLYNISGNADEVNFMVYDKVELNSIEITLKDSNGNKVEAEGLVNPTYTDEIGDYSFKNIPMPVENYHIEFNYDGKEYNTSEPFNYVYYETGDTAFEISSNILDDIKSDELNDETDIETSDEDINNVENIEVILKDSNGNRVEADGLVNPVLTNVDGEYEFNLIPLPEENVNLSEKYHIEFIYDNELYSTSSPFDDVAYEEDVTTFSIIENISTEILKKKAKLSNIEVTLRYSDNYSTQDKDGELVISNGFTNPAYTNADGEYKFYNIPVPDDASTILNEHYYIEFTKDNITYNTTTPLNTLNEEVDENGKTIYSLSANINDVTDAEIAVGNDDSQNEDTDDNLIIVVDDENTGDEIGLVTQDEGQEGNDEDVNDDSGDSESQDGDNSVDKILKGIKATLIKQTITQSTSGQQSEETEIATAYTGENGDYNFYNIKINTDNSENPDYIENFIIVFSYGDEIVIKPLTELSCEYKLAVSYDITSKVKEKEEQRSALDNAYQFVNATGTMNVRENTSKSQVIGGRGEFDVNYKSYIQEGKDTYSISNNAEKNESQLSQDGKTRSINNFDGYDCYDINKIEATTQIVNTDVLGMGKNTVDQIKKQGIEEIKNISCGLVRREQVNLTASADLVNAKISVNGYTNTYRYQYSKNKEYTGFVEDEYGNIVSGPEDIFRLDVKAKQWGYTRQMYASDIVYNGTDTCKVYLTYGLTVRNNSNTLSAKITNLANYHDARYTILNTGLKEDMSELAYKNGNWINGYTRNGYTVEYTDVFPQIDAGTSATIYVQYELSREAVVSILSGDVKLNNTIEINGYSTYYGENTYHHGENSKIGTYYASVDSGSAPGNIIIDNFSTYEKDAAQAPVVTMTLTTNERTIEGNVFEDILQQNENNEKILDGLYTEGIDNDIGNAKVELFEFDANKQPNEGEKSIWTKSVGDNVASMWVRTLPGNKFDEKFEPNYLLNNNGTLIRENSKGIIGGKFEARVKTDQTGHYKFYGIVPGNYVIKFTYGKDNEIFTVVKEETDSEPEIKREKITTLEGAEKYKSTVIKSNMIREALEMKPKTPTMWYKTTENSGRHSDAADDIEAYGTAENDTENDSYITINHGNQEIITDKQEFKSAYTAPLKVKFEYIEKDNNNLDNTDSIIDCTPNGDIVRKINSDGTEQIEKVYMYNVQNIDFGITVKNDIHYSIQKNIKRLKITSNAGQILINGNPASENLQYVKYLPGTPFIRAETVNVEMESNKLIGATLEIEYRVTAFNESAQNIKTYEYYYFGNAEEGKHETLKISKVIDYLSDDIVLNQESLPDNAYIGKIKQDDGTDKIYLIDHDGQEHLIGTAETYLEKSDNVDLIAKAKKSNNLLILTSEEELKTNDHIIWEYKASKVLTSGSKLEFSNDIEVIEIQCKTPLIGSNILGNYNPDEESKKLDISEETDFYSSQLAITTPTGGNKMYIQFIISAIALLITGIAIGIIKRKIQ